MIARSKNDGSPYRTTFTIKEPVKLQTSGAFNFDLFSYFYCDSGCEVAKDTINVKISTDIGLTFKSIGEISRVRDITWTNNSFNFYTSSTEIYVKDYLFSYQIKIQILLFFLLLLRFRLSFWEKTNLMVLDICLLIT